MTKTITFIIEVYGSSKFDPSEFILYRTTIMSTNRKYYINTFLVKSAIIKDNY